MKMRSFGVSAISVLMTAAVIGNAYYQKKQFYPSVVYITKSNASMAVIYVQFFVIVLMLGKLLRKIFLGTLRAAEFEHLMERFWYALTETCLAFTVFRDDFNPRFVALFTVLLFLKSFHWLAEERVDYMERSPIISWLFHIRAASLLFVLCILDYLMIMHAYNQTIIKGPTVQLVFGFEYAILITMIANITIKYVLHAAEMRSDQQWENKAVFLLYTELIIGLIKVILYLLFVIIMAKIYALPMFVFRPMFYTMRNFKKALNDVIMSRRAIRNMNTLYPDATPEELAMSDNICIICREDMISNSKKLPCGHIFHTACLRSWFQRQQTCPTCRLNILRTTAHNSNVQRPDQIINQAINQNNLDNQQQQQQQQQSSVFNINNNNNNNNNSSQNNNNNNIPSENSFTNSFNQMNTVNGINGNNAATINNILNPSVPFIFSSSTTPQPPPLPSSLALSFPFFAAAPPPYAIPPPPIPPGLDALTDDEIRVLEGNERRHVEERIKLLRNIQLLLDASVCLMNQYSAITSRLQAFQNIATTVAGNSVINTGIPSASTSSTSKESTKEQQTKNSDCYSDVPKSFLLKPELISSNTTTTTAAAATKTTTKINSIKINKFDGNNDDDNNKNLTDNKKIENQIHIEDIGSEDDDESIYKNIKKSLNDKNNDESDEDVNEENKNDEYVEKIKSKNNDMKNKYTTNPTNSSSSSNNTTVEIFSDNSELDELSQLRRRRLEKFLQQQQQQQHSNDKINKD